MLRLHQDQARAEGPSLNPTTLPVPAPIPTSGSPTAVVRSTTPSSHSETSSSCTGECMVEQSTRLQGCSQHRPDLQHTTTPQRKAPQTEGRLASARRGHSPDLFSQLWAPEELPLQQSACISSPARRPATAERAVIHCHFNRLLITPLLL